MEELKRLQREVSVPKNNTNAHGGFNYRSCEDIFKQVKPLLEELDCLMTISDELVHLGDRFYIKATVSLTNKDGATFRASALAREPENQTGMNQNQLTASTTSYARKNALSGMFLLDSGEDADSLDNSDIVHKTPTSGSSSTKYPRNENRNWLNEGTAEWDKICLYIMEHKNPEMEYILSVFKVSKSSQAKLVDMMKKMPENNETNENN